MLQRVRVFLLENTVLAISGIVAMGIILLFFVLPLPDEFKTNLVTELIGVWFTVILVDKLYKLKAKKEIEQIENQKIKNLHNLLSGYIQWMKFSTVAMTNPIGEKIKSDVQTLTVSDLQHLYNYHIHAFRPLYERAYQLYFRAVQGICSIFMQYLPHLDFNIHAELIRLMREFILQNDNNGLREAIEQRLTVRWGDEKAFEADVKMLQNYQGSEELHPTDRYIWDIYIAFLQVIKANDIVLTRYQNYLIHTKILSMDDIQDLSLVLSE